MKTLPDLHRLFAKLFLALTWVFAAQAQLPPPGVPLRLEWRTNAFDLIVGGVTNAGALFLHQASDLHSLADSPSLLLQTNTPLTNGLRLPVLPTGGFSNSAFYAAVHWPGRTVEEFGEPEDYPDLPPPAMILLTSGAPSNLASGQTFTVDFFVTDPAGQLLDVSGPVAILVLRGSDGVLHPDATVSPPTGQLTNGHLRVAVTIQSIASLDCYTLGLGPATGGLLAFLNGLLFPTSGGLDQFLKTAFNLGPAPLPAPTAQALLQTLEQRRTDNADPGPSWNYPLAVTGHPVSGTFGEWRGKDNNKFHRGVDLAAVAASTVVASRGGVVSHRGTLSDMGDYLVVDHGGGWFSRYLHLDSAFISVLVGQAVVRGATLATRLYAVGDWPQHLHFEIRRGANQSQWDVSLPGIGQDPLQTPDIFAVPPGAALPELREFGLTRQHLGQNAFVRAAPTADVPGTAYLFAKFLDLETGHRLGLRAIRFQPEGLAMPVEIRPQDETAIGALLPSAAGAEKGFAQYSLNHNGDPPQSDWFRYWWRWDTSSYANDRKGPRSLVLTGEDHAPSTAEFRFTFGPQVKGGTLTLVGPQQYQFTSVAHLGTNTPIALGNAALFVQQDQYKLEIIQANGQPLGGVAWSGPMSGNYTRVFTSHLEEAVYTFTLPGGTSADGLKLRVSSRLVPDIAHEFCLCAGPNMALIPAGSFQMGDTFGEGNSVELPVHSVFVSAFCMDKYEVTKALWDEVYSWALGHGYTFDRAGSATAINHPVHFILWYDMVKWCNARSEKEGLTPCYYTSAAQTTVYRTGRTDLLNSFAKWTANGYRLPTETEWEKGARGGLNARRFPWGDTISHSQANYPSQSSIAYDISPTRGSHPNYPNGSTSPAGSFAPNGYGVYDMAGNVWEWCWDWYGDTYGSAAATEDNSRGPAAATGFRALRGGGAGAGSAYVSRCAARGSLVFYPGSTMEGIGFRCVRGL